MPVSRGTDAKIEIILYFCLHTKTPLMADLTAITPISRISPLNIFLEKLRKDAKYLADNIKANGLNADNQGAIDATNEAAKMVNFCLNEIAQVELMSIVYAGPLVEPVIDPTPAQALSWIGRLEVMKSSIDATLIRSLFLDNAEILYDAAFLTAITDFTTAADVQIAYLTTLL